MDELAGLQIDFNFREYWRAHSYDLSHQMRRLIRVAQPLPWVVISDDWMSSVTQAKLDRLRVDWRVLVDVHLHAPDPTERADQPPAGMVAVNCAIMDAGLHFPLSLDVSQLLKF